ncbi:unnamed protein product [Adineta steineri]|uniref:Phospholipid-transporting ATPase n=1 Tax=Adineta steineri TaxID=433720 RepID=A0A815TU13_9BILA|nr:unnamed protein product [Adineta steineri]CAF1509117.1 unnamed protein product [Adineta steineri]CAF1509525.1 unnamed protein product [Adineta steineri]
MRRLFCCKKSKAAASNRVIKINDSIYNTSKKFRNNRISTTKYNVITFLPKNLFEQFRRLANVYFVFLLILLYIPQISSLQPISTLFSLIFVLTVTAIKDAVDDIARYRSDKQINNRRTEILINKQLIDKYWREIQVGDIIRIHNNDFIPADMILISSSEPNGLCLIETTDLDGESNLKPRQALKETVYLQDNLTELSNFNAEIECEQPNNNLLRFEGKLIWNSQTYALGNDNILLRGTRLRNTQWAFGIVCYAGQDTKLMQNSGKPKFKRTKIDHWLNKILIGIFIFLILTCSILAICNGFWEYNSGSKFRIYLPWESYVSLDSRTGAIQIAALIFFSYIILLNTVIPSSLYISIEIIRLFQAKWIDWDNQMYYEPNNSQAQSHTASLSEELGQIEYIFSDKTGTLTQNIMTFKKCSIRGKLYGDIINENRHNTRITTELENNNFIWYDQILIDAIENNDNNEINHFFTLLALCHTVISEEKNGKIIYQAQSPDENALVTAARSFGFEFLSRTQSNITVRFRNQTEIYDLLHILDFNNYRKRMSIIVRKHGKIILYCKGADSTIKERLDPLENDIMTLTDEHLHKVASEGLRTLCLAWKELNEKDYKKWANKLKNATTSMQQREEQMNDLYEEIEINMKLLGMTAIEDKLQDGVPECIEKLTQAGINIWMLTGDKIETAENVGFSCRLLKNNMIIKRIDEETQADVTFALNKFRNELIEKIEQLYNIHIDDRNKRLQWKNFNIPLQKINSEHHFQGFSLLITGTALIHALSNELKMSFLELSTMCKTVICCRVTPLQKAQIVELIRKNDKVITLAIGDGANDVSMIQKAHIGIGISGQEGRQAVLASDYSIGQFRFLERLLFVHGRWSYIRISKFLRYFFYKNFAFTFCQFWFAFYCGFSAQTIFDSFFVTLYNIFFTTFPVVTLGVHDQDISASHSISRPHLYIIGQKDQLFNRKIFAECALHGLITSCIIFFFSYLCLLSNTESSGIPLNDTQSFGFMVATILVIVVNLENALEMWYWSGIYMFILSGTIILHFIFHFVIYSTLLRLKFKINYPYVGIAQVAMTNVTFWFTLLLICVILLLPIIGREFFRIRFIPNETDKARLIQKFCIPQKKETVIPTDQEPRQRPQSVRSTGSGYAFSQQKGWGPLITSGTLRTKSATSSHT